MIGVAFPRYWRVFYHDHDTARQTLLFMAYSAMLCQAADPPQERG
jgi:hypothetical protein